MGWIIEHQVAVLAALLAISELLDAVPSIQASSIWKLLYNALKGLAGKSSS